MILPKTVPLHASVSVVIPTIDETVALEETIGLAMGNSCSHILEVLLVVCDRTTERTLGVCRNLQDRFLGQVRIVRQSLPFLGGAFQAGISVARGSHILLMFADLESDPRTIPAMISAAEKEPLAVVSASRWLRKGGFVGYGYLKSVLNYCFQRLCASVCQSGVTDFTYGFRLYPAAVLKGGCWKEVDHAFVLETILKPILSNLRIMEVPAVWVGRKDGKRRSRVRQYSRYLFTLVQALIWARRLQSAVPATVKTSLS